LAYLWSNIEVPAQARAPLVELSVEEMAAMTSWDDKVRVTAGSVSLELPAIVVKTQDTSIDSAGGVFEGGGLTVIVDEGPFADRLDAYVGLPDFREDTMEVAQTTARRIFFRRPDRGTYTIGIHVPAPKHVTVAIHAEASIPEHIAEAIIDSLRID
jgi:hypothetical protein